MTLKLTQSFARGKADIPLIEKTIGAYLDEMVARQPDHEALVSHHEKKRYTYSALQLEANRLASAFLGIGLEPGDRLGIWAHNGSAWLLTQLATAKIGVILVNINPAYRGDELEYALNKVDCKALVVMPSFKSSNYLAMALEVAPELAYSRPGQLVATRVPALRSVFWIDTPQPVEVAQGIRRFSDLLCSGDPYDVRLEQVSSRLKSTDPINIQFTSGTTGFPKGATLTHRSLLNNGFFVGERMKLTRNDRLCVPVPLYHCFGMVMGNLACLTHGSTIVYPSEGFDPLSVLEVVQEEKCTALHGVPTMFIAELDHPRFADFDLRTLRTGCMAGSPCPIEVMRRVIDLMHLSEITIAYGMTETSPISCQSSTETPLKQRVSTVGTVQEHLEVKVVDPESGVVVSLGQPGELCTRGYSVMDGYWGDPEKTDEAIDSDGWMHSGDLATLDVDGYFNIVGRIKDMVIRGGENIYPREIEEFLFRHPKIQDVQVVGVPDKKFGEELCAWIVIRPSQTLSDEEVRTYCIGKIAHYKVPRHIRFVTEFPTTVTGKVQKYKIREIMALELGYVGEQTA